MDIRDIVFEAIDARTFDTLDPPRREPDGSLAWTPTVPQGDMDVDEGMEMPPWLLEARAQRVGPFTLDIDLNVHWEPRIGSEALGRLSALLGRIESVDAVVRGSVLARYQSNWLMKEYFVPALYESLEKLHLGTLFPGAADPVAVTPEIFFGGLTFCRLGYYDRYREAEDDPGQELVVADYRFLVPELVGTDLERADDYLQYGGRYDVTNQTVTAKLQLDGTLLDVSVES